MSKMVTCPQCQTFRPRDKFTDGVCSVCASVNNVPTLSTRPREFVPQKEAQERLSLKQRLKAEAERAEQERIEAFNKEQEALKELARREAARRNLLPFVMYFNEQYTPGWVHADICRRLEQFSKDVVEGKSPRLMLFMPPRSGKLCADSTPVLTTKGWTTHGVI
ncbi:hypothetical protein [Pasteurella testudinis]|uniref:hypothetical protein n=1 Tax=Pasteurella testudinis TaxID=761 RepID=UPI00405A46A8